MSTFDSMSDAVLREAARVNDERWLAYVQSGNNTGANSTYLVGRAIRSEQTKRREQS